MSDLCPETLTIDKVIMPRQAWCLTRTYAFVLVLHLYTYTCLNNGANLNLSLIQVEESRLAKYLRSVRGEP